MIIKVCPLILTDIRALNELLVIVMDDSAKNKRCLILLARTPEADLETMERVYKYLESRGFRIAPITFPLEYPMGSYNWLIKDYNVDGLLSYFREKLEGKSFLTLILDGKGRGGVDHYCDYSLRACLFRGNIGLEKIYDEALKACQISSISI